MRYALAAVLMLATLPASAAPSLSECRQVAEAATNNAQAVRRMATVVGQRNAGAAAAQTTGALKDAFYRFEERRRELLPALEGYAEASENLAAQMRDCAGR
jgi:hypothetical protein